MTVRFRYVAVVFAIAALVGCSRVEPILDVPDGTVPQAATHRLSADEVKNTLAKVALDDGWIVDASVPGRLRCTMKWRVHEANVDISYSDRGYAIRYVSSDNLMAGNGDIHRNYNRRIVRLRNDIDHALSVSANRPSGNSDKKTDEKP